VLKNKVIHPFVLLPTWLSDWSVKKTKSSTRSISAFDAWNMLKLKKMIVSPIFSIFSPVIEVLEFVVYTCNIIFVCSDAHFASFRRATSIYYNSFFKIINFLWRTPSTIMAVFPRFVSVCVISMTDHWLLKYIIIYIHCTCICKWKLLIFTGREH
jgi:hypothetical protein